MILNSLKNIKYVLIISMISIICCTEDATQAIITVKLQDGVTFPSYCMFSLYSQSKLIVSNYRLPEEGKELAFPGTISLWLSEGGTYRFLLVGYNSNDEIGAWSTSSFTLGNNETIRQEIVLQSSEILDQDNDKIPDEIDNCPETANPIQEDEDANGTGDVCSS